MQGIVVMYDKEKGYGFIESDNKSIFFHHSQLVMEGFKTIEVNEMVEFELSKTDKGFQASNILRI